MLCPGRFLRRNGNKEEEKMKNNNRFTTAQLTLLGLMAAILLLMAYTPLGYLNIGPLAISFNVIPVAISAVVLGLFFLILGYLVFRKLQRGFAEEL